MNMFIHELKRLLCEPMIWAIVSMFTLISIINVINNRSFSSTYVHRYVNEYRGTFDEKEEDYIAIFNEIEEKRSANPHDYGVGMPFTVLETSYKAENRLFEHLKTLIKAHDYRLETIKKLNKQLKAGTKTEKVTAAFWLERLEARENERLEVYVGWQQFAIYFNMFGQILSLLIIGFGISELYSADKELRLEELFLSYPYGRSLSTKIKIYVAAIYSLTCGLLTCTLSILQLMIDGGVGADDYVFTILGLQNTPFNTSIIIFFVEWCIYHIVGCVCVGIITLYASSYINKKVVTSFIPILMYIANIILTNTLSQLGYKKLAAVVGMVINPVGLLNGGLIKTNFENVSLDLPIITVPYYIVTPVLIVAITFMCTILLKRRMDKVQA